MWEPSCRSTSSPRLVLTWTPIWLVIVPEGAYRAASLPSNPATYSSSRFTVGSSPNTSSPTGASSIARRIPSVGRVTVSLRRSINGYLRSWLLSFEHQARGREADLGHLGKTLLPEFRKDTAPCLQDVRRAERQPEPDLLREGFDLLQLPRPRHDGRGGHGGVVFGPGPYLQPHFLRNGRLQILPGGSGKLVHHHDLDLVRKFAHDFGVELAEQPVNVSGDVPSGLVLPGRERDDVDVVPADGLEDRVRNPLYAGSPDLLGISNPYLLQPFRHFSTRDTDPGHDQGPEVVAFSGLVDAEPGCSVEDGLRPGATCGGP